MEKTGGQKSRATIPLRNKRKNDSITIVKMVRGKDKSELIMIFADNIFQCTEGVVVIVSEPKTTTTTMVRVLTLKPPGWQYYIFPPGV